MVLGMGWVSFRCCYGGGRSHRYSSGSIAPRTASDLVEEKVQTIGMDMGEVLPKTRSSRRRVSSSPSLTAHLGGTASTAKQLTRSPSPAQHPRLAGEGR